MAESVTPTQDTDKAPRRAIARRLRFEILRRDNYACRYCGGAAPDVKLTIDHVVPVVLGGTDDPANLVTACVDCNSGKTSSSPDAPLVADVASDALRWAVAMKEAQRLSTRRRDEQEEHRQYVYTVWRSHFGHDRDLPATYGPSVDDFIAAGLTYDDFEYAAEVTAQHYRRDPWRYFCGICWNRVSALQVVARQLLEAGEG